tara:strand:+ start:306 stop:632 length:327 start_codon:yes stop_codon:yes gene_type:complete
MLKVLDLFSGIGGFSRGFEATNFFETISFVENEPYCQAVLKHHWPEVPVLGDIKNVKAEDLPTRPDVGRLVDGLPNRVPQLRALGNSIIPQIAEKIGQAIKETYDVYK